MIDLKPHAEGTVLPVRARPGARRSEIRGHQDGQLRVCVTEAPERGKANRAVIAVLAGSLSLRKSQLELIGGQTSRKKRFLVRGITPDELAGRIEKVLAEIR